MNTATDSLETNSPKSGGGVTMGQSASDLIAFYGATPAVQPSSASQSVVTAITDSSGGTGSYTTGIQALSATFNSTLIANGISTVAAQGNANKVLINQLRSDLVALGLIKGSA